MLQLKKGRKKEEESDQRRVIKEEWLKKSVPKWRGKDEENGGG